MKIAMVCHSGVVDDARVLKEARSLAQGGHEVAVFGLHDDEESDYIDAYGVRISLAKRDRAAATIRWSNAATQSKESWVLASFSAQAAAVSRKLLRSFKPDVVHIHDHVMLTLLRHLREATGAHIVWDAHEIYEDTAQIDDARRAISQRLIRQASLFIDSFITINPSIAKFYADKYPELGEATILPNSQPSIPTPRYDGRLHDKLGLARDRSILLFQGGLAPHRGIPQLLKAAKCLPDNWTTVFMGWGSLYDEVRASELVGDSPDAERVRSMPGVPHSELPEWTSGATIGAIPYEDVGLNHRFCTPNKIWEYSTAGVPILATDLPELGSTVRDAKIGWTIPTDFTAQSISDVIGKISLTDHQTAKSALKGFLANSNWDIHETALLELYEGIPLKA